MRTALRRITGAEKAAQTAALQPRQNKSAGITILLAGDCEEGKTAVKLLRNMGHRVTALRTEEGARKVFKRDPGKYDLAIIDYEMSYTTGYSLAKSLKKICPDIPLLLCIDPDTPFSTQRAVEAGKAIGNGFYGVDLKQAGNEYVVIEVNDNPSINAGEEDQANGDLYERLIHFLLPNGTNHVG